MRIHSPRLLVLLLAVGSVAGCNEKGKAPPPAAVMATNDDGVEEPTLLREVLRALPNLQQGYTKVEESRDNWETEQFHVVAKKRLTKSLKLLSILGGFKPASPPDW